MQSNKNVIVSTSQFSDLWTKCSKVQRSDLMSEIVAKTRVTSATVYNWAKGTYIPTSYPVKLAVANCVSKVLGVKTSADILFPSI